MHLSGLFACVGPGRRAIITVDHCTFTKTTARALIQKYIWPESPHKITKVSTEPFRTLLPLP